MIDKLLTNAIIAVVVFIAGLATGAVWQKGKYDDKLRAAEKTASKQRDDAAAAWAEVLAGTINDLGTERGRAAALDRCIASGRCSPATRNRMLRNCPVTIPTPGVPDATRPEPVPAGSGEATDDGQEAIAGLIQDCAVTTAQLNELQRVIEAQPGY